MSGRLPRRRLHAAALACALALAGAAGCAARRTDAPPVEMPAAFSEPGTQAAPAKWWTALGDPQLDALVEQALAGNLDLKSTWDRLDQAAALARQAGADLYPSVTAAAAATRTRTDTGNDPAVYANEFGLGVAASYEVDLWGRVRATADAAALEVRATREDLAAAAMTLAAQVAATWYGLVERTGQLDLLDQQIRTNTDYLELVTLRFRRGKVSAVDVLQQRQLVEATRAERVQVESSAKVLAHELAVLLGRPPAAEVAGGAGAGRLPALPPLPATGLPSALLQRRPDTRGAMLRLQEADRGVAAAVADQFPRISLSAGAETTALEARNLFDNWLADVAANLTAPLLDGGRRRAEVDRTRAVAAERLHDYGRAALAALREVEDALVQETHQARYLASLDQQLDLSAKALAQTRGQYVNGTLDYLRVLAALQSHQDLQRRRLQAAREWVGFRIDLYRALGGGWEMARPAEGPGGAPADEAAR